MQCANQSEPATKYYIAPTIQKYYEIACRLGVYIYGCSLLFLLSSNLYHDSHTRLECRNHGCRQCDMAAWWVSSVGETTGGGVHHQGDNGGSSAVDRSTSRFYDILSLM